MKAPITTMLSLAVLMQTGAFAADNESQMQQHMGEMRDLMAAIKTEQDPEKHGAMMQQHMEAMREGMQMMGQSEEAAGMSMESRMEGMEQHMEMMQMMMGQMMEHDSEESAGPAQQHE